MKCNAASNWYNNNTSTLALMTSVLVAARIGWTSSRMAKIAAWQHVIILPCAMLPTSSWQAYFSPFDRSHNLEITLNENVAVWNIVGSKGRGNKNRSSHNLCFSNFIQLIKQKWVNGGLVLLDTATWVKHKMISIAEAHKLSVFVVCTVWIVNYRRNYIIYNVYYVDILTFCFITLFRTEVTVLMLIEKFCENTGKHYKIVMLISNSMKQQFFINLHINFTDLLYNYT